MNSLALRRRPGCSAVGAAFLRASMANFTAILVVAVIGFVGLGAASSSSAATSFTTTYDYAAQAYDPPGSNATPGRGPPAHRLINAAYDGAAGPLPRGSWARADSVAPPSAFITYDGRSSHAFTSADAHVADAANAVEAAFRGRVVDVNVMRTMSNGLSREVDIDLGNLFVQVKSGNARGLTGQIGKTQSSSGVQTIGYPPDITAAALKNAASQGIPILSSPGELLAYIRVFG